MTGPAECAQRLNKQYTQLLKSSLLRSSSSIKVAPRIYGILHFLHRYRCKKCTDICSGIHEKLRFRPQCCRRRLFFRKITFFRPVPCRRRFFFCKNYVFPSCAVPQAPFFSEKSRFSVLCRAAGAFFVQNCTF